MPFDPTPLLRLGVRYAPLHAARAALWSLAAARAQRPRRFVARTRHGFRYGGDQRLIIPRCIYWFGHWEPLLTRWMRSALRPGDVVVDVGANAGYFTLLAATAVGATGRVVAIEPLSRTRKALEANLARNGAGNVRTVAAAVGASEGMVRFYRAAVNNSESSTVPRRGLELEGEVPAAPLRTLLTADEAARTALVKIDVEGAEAEALRGMSQDSAWMPDRLRVVVEVHSHVLVMRGLSIGELIAPFAALGFTTAWLPVDFSERAHLQAEGDRTPRTTPLPEDRLFHLILARG
jgi:FkbM family methyltransferase